MTFTEIVTEVAERLNLTSSTATARIGRAVNARYRRVTSSIGVQVARRTTNVVGTTSIGYATVTFSGLEKLERVIDDRSGSVKVLKEITFDDLRAMNPGTGDPTCYAIQSMDAGSVTIRLDITAQTTYNLKADGLATAATMSGSQVPQFDQDYHDILVEGAVADELKKQEKAALAKDAEQLFEKRLSELRYFIAKSAMLLPRQNGSQQINLSGGVTNGGGGSAPSGGTSYEQTGLVSFNRGTNAPFAVDSGAAKVANLDADKLDGLDSTAFALASANTADVTLAGTPNYLTIAAQVITRALINLTSHVTGRLPFANLVAGTAGSKLVGTSASGAGDFAEITLGTGLSMSGSTLNAAGGLSQSFRGLQLRTHPDSDVAKSKVMLVHADAAVMDDGTQVTSGIDNLVADVTASGAGGLDTGSEGASRWYDVYLIRKSSDGTLNLLLHRTRTYSIDTSFTTAPDVNRKLRLSTSTATDKLAQGLQFASAGPLVAVDVDIFRNNAPTGNAWFTLESDNAGSPSGSVLATSDKVDVSKVSTGSGLVKFVFRTPYSVTASTQYHLVLQGDYTKSDTIGLALRGLAAGGYSGGSAKEFNGTSWSAMSGVGDIYFRAYLTLNDTAITYPTGYNQKCFVGYVYNSSGSDFEPFVQHERAVDFLGSTGTSNSLASVTATSQSLVDMSAWLPPGTVRSHVMARNATATSSVYMSGLPDGYGRSVLFAGLMYSPTGAAMQHTLPVLTEYQAMYAWVDANTGTVWVLGYQW